MAILTEIRDPRVQNVTVTSVEVMPDMREAKVYISVMGTESQKNLCLRGLASSAGFLQSKIAERIDTRYTPRLQFVLDEGVKKSIEVAQILDRLAAERSQAEVSMDLEEPNPEHLNPDSLGTSTNEDLLDEEQVSDQDSSAR